MNPWKLTAIGMALVMVTAVVTGLVVANRTGDSDKKVEADKMPVAASPAHPVTAQAAPVRRETAAPPHPAAPPRPAVPTQAAIDACNQWAGQQTAQRDKTMDTVKDAALGAVVGAAVGAAGGAIADGGKGAGKGAAIGGVVGAGAGTVYGLNENRKQDQRYRDAYAACMRGRGYSS
jgi:hypothetical protein